jgi:hypothetical protein
MTMPAELFRREALEYSSHQRGPGAVLRIGTPWIRWLYWVVLALVAAGVALTFVVPIERTTSGPALLDPQDRTFVAALPADAGSDLSTGRPVRLEVDGPAGRQDVTASVLQARPAENADARRAGFSTFPQPAVLVTGVLTPDAVVPTGSSPSPRLPGRAVVLLGSTRAASLFLQGFQGGDG